MKKIPKDARIMSISHNDFDGVTCQIVLGCVFENIKYISASFYNVDDILESVEYDKYDYVFLTDICPNDKSKLDLSPKIILLDHHETSSELFDETKLRLIDTKHCGAWITKAFLEHMYGEKLSQLDELVRLANDYDMWHLTDPKSKQMNDVMFYMYRAHKFRQAFADGRSEFNQAELDFLKERENHIEKLYDDLEVYDLSTVQGCVTYQPECMNELAEKLYQEEGYPIVIIRNNKSGRCSIRCHIDGFNAGKLAEKISEKGGGHADSAGFWSESEKDFLNKVGLIEEHLHRNFPDLRRKQNADAG